MKKAMLIVLITAAAQSGFAQLNGILKKAEQKLGTVTKPGTLPLSQEEVGRALKEALGIGVTDATRFLSAKDGYFKSLYKITLPDESLKVIQKLKNVPGFGNLEADLTERINRAAEKAATKAQPIFTDALTKLTFTDALALLSGNKDAATRYLEKNTSAQLNNAFLPVVQQALDEVNARSLWRSAVTAYNKLPFVTKTNPELDQHVTQSALKGLFSLIEVKENGIRSDVKMRSSDLLRKVFAQQDKK